MLQVNYLKAHTLPILLNSDFPDPRHADRRRRPHSAGPLGDLDDASGVAALRAVDPEGSGWVRIQI